MKEGTMKRKSRTDWARVRAMRDEDIDYTDSPELDDEWFANAVLAVPVRKDTITIRLDRDVLDWFKSRGPGYQTRINAILTSYMRAQTSATAKRKSKATKSKKRA